MATQVKSQPAVTLFRGFNGKGFYVWSPFVNKLEASFRFAGLQYATGCGSPTTAPRGKIPYIQVATLESSTKPRLIGDSALIVSEFIEQGILENLNTKLSPAEQAIDLAIQALLEDKLYFYMVRRIFFSGLGISLYSPHPYSELRALD